MQRGGDTNRGASEYNEIQNAVDGYYGGRDRKSVVQGKSVDLGGRSIIKKKNKKKKKKKQTKKKKKHEGI